MHINDFLQNNLESFEKEMYKHVEEGMSRTQEEEAMLYSLKSGGKRLRPMLLLAVVESLGEKISKGYPAAIALEMIHTYSLIHDDLPAMDDDDLRRGNPSNHKIFGEATAILAGDALLTKAFKIVSTGDLENDQKIALVQALADAAGHEGMVGGQQADMEGEEKDLTLEELKDVHHKKTGALLRFAFYAGAVIARTDDFTIEKLDEIAQNIGLAYQIRDDILDVTSDTETLGKEVGSDLAQNKSTYPSILGIDGAKKELKHYLQESDELIQNIDKERKKQGLPFTPKLLSTFVGLLDIGENS
jgi:geranylgeranyl diphosphate synthase type II